MEWMMGQGAPYFFDHVNLYESMGSPSTVHVKNTGLRRFFERHLLQKAMSVFEWEVPDNWSIAYTLYSLYCWGFYAVLKTDKFGIIPQACTLSGYNLFYEPNTAIISNPLIRGRELRIGETCSLVRLCPDYRGIMDIVGYYADMMALCAENAGVNFVNTKLAYVFAAENKNQSDSFKKLFDNIASGEPAAFYDKRLNNDDGSVSWQMFNQNLAQSYIAGDVISDMRKIEAMFATEIGIPNANTDKKERLVTDEVNANNFETKSKVEMWLEQIRTGIKETKELFGDIKLSVKWRTLREEGESDGVESGNANANRSV